MLKVFISSGSAIEAKHELSPFFCSTSQKAQRLQVEYVFIYCKISRVHPNWPKRILFAH